MSFFKYLCLSLFLLLTGCGGASQDDSGLVSQVQAPGVGSTLQLKLVDSTDVLIANNTLGLNSTGYYVQARVQDSSATPVRNQLVTFTTNPIFATFVNGTTTVITATPTGTVTVARMTALTNETGIAKVQLLGKGLGADVVVADTKVNSTTVTTTLSYQVGSLTGIGGVSSLVPTSLRFVSATPSQILVATAGTGQKQSIVKFRVLNELDVAISGQSVLLSLDSQSIGAGVTFIKDGVSSAAPQTVKSDIDGTAQIVVSAGALPTGVVVSAQLVSNTRIGATSLGLSVSNGRVSQMSLNAVSPTVEGFNLDNVSTEIKVIARDRLGNPVPEGTVVNFVSSHGLIGTFVVATTTSIVTNTLTGTATVITTSVTVDSKGTCVLTAASSCQVVLKSAGARPSNGKVNILAYADGEEIFNDLNGNNRWEMGEPFTDMGMAYLDVNGSNNYEIGIDQAIPGGKTGTSLCPATDISIGNTCDGVWSDYIRVRQRMTVVWATSRAKVTSSGNRTLIQMQVTVLDLNGNEMAPGTVVTAEVGDASLCRVRKVLALSDGLTPGQYLIQLNGDPSCATAEIDVIVTSPSGITTFQAFN